MGIQVLVKHDNLPPIPATLDVGVRVTPCSKLCGMDFITATDVKTSVSHSVCPGSENRDAQIRIRAQSELRHAEENYGPDSMTATIARYILTGKS